MENQYILKIYIVFLGKYISLESLYEAFLKVEKDNNFSDIEKDMVNKIWEVISNTWNKLYTIDSKNLIQKKRKMEKILVKIKTFNLFIISQVLAMMILSVINNDISSLVLFAFLFFINGIVHDY